MAIIQWNDSLSVHVDEFDKQHQKLVAMINELHDAMKQGKGKDVLGEIVQRLIDYTKTHFAAEEKYFAQFKYPEASSHKLTHAGFLHKVSEFKDNFEKGQAGVSLEVLKFLSDWLQVHIKGMDKKYGTYFKAKGFTKPGALPPENLAVSGAAGK